MNLGGMAKRDGIVLHGENVTVTATVEKEEIIVKTQKNKGGKVLFDINVPFLRGLARTIDIFVRTIKSSPKIFVTILFVTIGIPLILLLFGAEVSMEKTDSDSGTYTTKILSLILILVMFQFTNIGKFHAGEHMVIAALEKGLEPTIENIEKQERVHERCGSVWSIYISILATVMAILGVPSLWVTLISLSVGYELFVLNKETKLFKIIKPIYNLAIIIQKYVFTSKPNAEQLKCAAKAGEEILRQESSKKELATVS